MPASLPVLLSLIALQASSGAPAAETVLAEIRGLQGQVAALRFELAQRDAGLRGLKEDLASVQEELRGLRERPAGLVAAPFLAAPPPSSDTVGVAKVAVFAPRVEVDSTRRHDVVFLKVRRLEAGPARAVSETELSTDQTGVDLTLDQSGALYSVEWSTSEGYSYSLVLRDGATGLPAATVQVKPLQAQGRFLFVGYRLD